MVDYMRGWTEAVRPSPQRLLDIGRIVGALGQCGDAFIHQLAHELEQCANAGQAPPGTWPAHDTGDAL